MQSWALASRSWARKRCSVDVTSAERCASAVRAPSSTVEASWRSAAGKKRGVRQSGPPRRGIPVTDGNQPPDTSRRTTEREILNALATCGADPERGDLRLEREGAHLGEAFSQKLLVSGCAARSKAAQ